MTLTYEFHYKDYELRACDKRLVANSGDWINSTIDFVKWNDYENGRYCFSIGYFIGERDGYSFKFVGDRPFEYIDVNDLPIIWEALRQAQETLNNFYRKRFDND